MTNAFATKGRAAVEAARARGHRVGLLRLRVLRPWPADAIRAALRGRRAVAVVDQNLAPGLGGILFQEIAATLYAAADRPHALCSFIGGLGGKNLSDGELAAVLAQTAEAGARGTSIGPVLLYTDAERREVEQMQFVATEMKT
jgi:pyruvate ferredoxin oxidoreductase alpha subunit